MFVHVERINSQTNKTVGVAIYSLWLLDVSSENNKRFLPLGPWLMHSLTLHKLPPTTVFHQEVGDFMTSSELTVFVY